MAPPVWVTPAGSIGVFPAQLAISTRVEANPVLPALNVTYKVISGSLPTNVTLRSDGLISGTPPIVSSDTSYEFVVRATDNLDNIKDRTFSLTVSGTAIPQFLTPSGDLFTTEDSLWIEVPILYSNPIASNKVLIRVLQGELPPGLEINEFGLIRGYPKPPVITQSFSEIETTATSTNSTTNYITVLSTNDFYPNRPVVFSGTLLGGLSSSTVYYVKEIINATQFTVTTIPDGSVLSLASTDSGLMTVTLQETDLFFPASKRLYSFTLELISDLGNDRGEYKISILNQNLPVSEGGPGKPLNTRVPTIYNTRPPTYNIESSLNYGYYVLPPSDTVSIPGTTYPLTSLAYIGRFLSDNLFSFRVLGHDFDDNKLEYFYLGYGSEPFPSFLTGDSETGWIYGDPSLLTSDIEEFAFRVQVQKVGTSITSPVFEFKFKVTKDITGNITWITNTDLGTFSNATRSIIDIKAISDVSLIYRVVGGDLPPNLILSENGELIGTIAYQPTIDLQEQNDTATFTFDVEAYNPDFIDPDGGLIVANTATFTMTIKQILDIPTDNLVIKCSPGLEDRDIIRTLLNDSLLIPNSALYRPNDAYFGKAKNITYAHAYGIYSSDLEDYINAVKKNHYWRNITLGGLKTAQARNSKNEVIYEVVYSTIIDNLQVYDPKYNFDFRFSTSVSEEIFWPRFIDLNLGPWYASSNEIYTSYIFAQDAFLITNFREYDITTQDGIPLLLQQGVPTFYTSLTPGYARVLYPNSLQNMRERVEQELGADYNFNLLPLWMTSQQADGNTLGFTPAWVIAYTKPGFAESIKSNIENNWPYKLNQINFRIDRFTVDKVITYDYDSIIDPSVWTAFPSATPEPNPIDSENFYVLFPQKTILPTESQY